MARNSNGARYRKNRRRYRRMRILRAAAVVAVVLILIAAGLFFRSRKKESAAVSEPEIVSSAVASAQTVEQPAAEPEAQQTPEELFYEKLLQNPNATRTAPQVTDPATWEASAKEIMEGLAAANGYDLKAKQGFPYLIAVNRAASTATVYTANAEGRYLVPYMAIVVSCGKDSNSATPLGKYSTFNDKNIPNCENGKEWKTLNDKKYGHVYGQYATRIVGGILFHSVPYLTKDKTDLEPGEYNKLGEPASAGCVRMAVVDVKWIRDNCPLGTPVIIYDDAQTPGPMGKPGTINMDETNAELRGWDPTDPDPKNPWPEQYRTGTAILSQAAAEAQATGTGDTASVETGAVAASSSKAVSSSSSTTSSSNAAPSRKEEPASSQHEAVSATKETAAAAEVETPKQEKNGTD